MSDLPEELWREILEIGINNSKLSYKDLCCISISCTRLHRLSAEDSLWSHLLSFDFPNPTNPYPSSSSAKSLYKIRFERERERKLLVYRRAVLRKESQISEHSRKLREIRTRLNQENAKMNATIAELSNLSKVRQASVALNVWQPEVIRGRQKEIVEQCVVPVESRLRGLEMELRLCKQQIRSFDKAYRDEKQRLDTTKEELLSMKYHPLRDYKMTSSEDNECNTKRRKLKRSVEGIDIQPIESTNRIEVSVKKSHAKTNQAQLNK